MSKHTTTIEIDEKGFTKIMVDGQPIGLIREFKLQASAGQITPMVAVELNELGKTVFNNATLLKEAMPFAEVRILALGVDPNGPLILDDEEVVDGQ